VFIILVLIGSRWKGMLTGNLSHASNKAALAPCLSLVAVQGVKTPCYKESFISCVSDSRFGVSNQIQVESLF
jgi:hypothetical protein